MKLPKPDAFGSFWFGSKPGDPQHPAIIHSARLKGFIVSLGPRGMLFRGDKLAVYDTPQEAAKALRKLL